MSHFSSVDASPDPDALVAYLDATAAGLTAMKHYVAAAAHRAVGTGLVVDVGCGAGHDLELLGRAGVEPAGVDPSASMLDAARSRARRCGLPIRLVRATAEAIPFRSGGVDGCRVERVVQHVADPGRVFSELARIVRGGGFLAAFEPDWQSLRFGRGDVGADDGAVARAIVRARQPGAGRQLERLAEDHQFLVDDRVSEVSFGRRIDDFPIPLERAVRRAVADGRLDGQTAVRWLAHQRALDRAGRFEASWTKVLVVATRR